MSRRSLLSFALLLAAPTALAQSLPADRLDTFATGVFGESAAEIVAYDAASQRLFFVNAAAAQVVALDASDPAELAEAFTLDATAYGASANSVAVANGVVAVAP